MGVQWNHLIRTPLGLAVMSFVESKVVLFQRCTFGLSFVESGEVCPLSGCSLSEVSLYLFMCTCLIILTADSDAERGEQKLDDDEFLYVSQYQ